MHSRVLASARPSRRHATVLARRSDALAAVTAKLPNLNSPRAEHAQDLPISSWPRVVLPAPPPFAPPFTPPVAPSLLPDAPEIPRPPPPKASQIHVPPPPKTAILDLARCVALLAQDGFVASKVKSLSKHDLRVLVMGFLEGCVTRPQPEAPSRPQEWEDFIRRFPPPLLTGKDDEPEVKGSREATGPDKNNTEEEGQERRDEKPDDDAAPAASISSWDRQLRRELEADNYWRGIARILMGKQASREGAPLLDNKEMMDPGVGFRKNAAEIKRYLKSRRERLALVEAVLGEAGYDLGEGKSGRPVSVRGLYFRRGGRGHSRTEPRQSTALPSRGGRGRGGGSDRSWVEQRQPISLSGQGGRDQIGGRGGGGRSSSQLETSTASSGRAGRDQRRGGGRAGGGPSLERKILKELLRSDGRPSPRRESGDKPSPRNKESIVNDVFARKFDARRSFSTSARRTPTPHHHPDGKLPPDDHVDHHDAEGEARRKQELQAWERRAAAAADADASSARSSATTPRRPNRDSRHPLLLLPRVTTGSRWTPDIMRGRLQAEEDDVETASWRVAVRRKKEKAASRRSRIVTGPGRGEGRAPYWFEQPGGARRSYKAGGTRRAPGGTSPTSGGSGGSPPRRGGGGGGAAFSGDGRRLPPPSASSGERIRKKYNDNGVTAAPLSAERFRAAFKERRKE